jgi:hypothetical protein
VVKNKNVKNIFLSMLLGFEFKARKATVGGNKISEGRRLVELKIPLFRKNVFDIHFTKFGAVMTTVLPVLFKYCVSDSRKL